MPFEKLIQKINKKLTHTRKKAAREYLLESQNEIDKKINYNELINNQIESFKESGGIFNGFAVAESAIRALFYNLLLDEKSKYNIIELGGGQSTLFLNQLSNQLDISLYSYEHDQEWFEKLKEMVGENDALNLNLSPLANVSDHEFTEILNSDNGFDIWRNKSMPLAENMDKDTRAKNCFYNVSEPQLPSIDIADVFILDGPHGNGRALAYSIFKKFIGKGTYILIDDYHHYPFLPQLQELYNVEVIVEKRYQHSNKGWVLAKVV
ncbi:MAG: hypothetical protein OQJ89_04035 [Kangiellaceae bacterium]|nr:hypothetical protein [Kangiellaceae bacterium]MCW9016110.1 hypothetical protein [Kangiellaceae bacterium]